MKASSKRILFKVAGSFEIGLGHIRRSLTLADEIAEYIGADNIFIYCDCPSKNATDLLTPYKFFLKDRDDREIIYYISRFNIDTLVIDELQDNRELCRVLKNETPKVIISALDYFSYDNEFIDVIINLFNQNLEIRNPKERFKGKYYEGLEYAIIRDAFDKYITTKKKPSSVVEKILITFGGADMRNNTIDSLNLLDNIGYQGEVDVIIGPFFKNKEEILENIKPRRYTCFVHENVSDIGKYIYNADLGFIGAGTTIMEFCSVGTPSIVMPRNKREYRFAKFFEVNNAVRVLNSDEDNLSLIEEVINNKALREKMSENSKKLIDGKGRERIKSIILES